jgi:hypothetical protein
VTTTAAVQQPELALDVETPHLAPGIHDRIPATRYHADPAARPSLSAHVAATICQRTPRHAYEEHSRLNPHHDRQDEQKFDMGTAVHAMVLDGEDVCAAIDAPDWRTAAAKAARDGARAEGLIPLLAHQHEQACAITQAVRAQLDALDIDPPLLRDGRPEQTLIWEDEGGIICRARPDWLRDDLRACDDLKTTAGSADPREWARRRMFDIGADVQAAFYTRGLRKLTGRDVPFRFVVIETVPPYALSVVALAPSAVALADDKVDHAIATWAECIATGDWPGYARDVAYAEVPAWEQERWLEARAIEEEAAAMRPPRRST